MLDRHLKEPLIQEKEFYTIHVAEWFLYNVQFCSPLKTNAKNSLNFYKFGSFL